MTAPGTDPGGDGVLTAGELRQTLDEVGVCTWSLDVAEGQVTASPACARLFGVPLDRLSTFAEIQALVHPDDRRGWEDAIQRTLRAGGAYEFDHRVVRPDGEVCWLRSRGRLSERHLLHLHQLVGNRFISGMKLILEIPIFMILLGFK